MSDSKMASVSKLTSDAMEHFAADENLVQGSASVSTSLVPTVTATAAHGGLAVAPVFTDNKIGGNVVIQVQSETKSQPDSSVLLQNVRPTLKEKTRKKFEHVVDSSSISGNKTFLNDIYTELYILEGGSGEINTEHEVRRTETSSKKAMEEEITIHYNDIFKPLPGQRKRIRTAMTKGIAGIGKTVSVQKFILDWAEGKANLEFDFVFTLPFRNLNLRKTGRHSLMGLLHYYFPELKDIQDIECCQGKLVFILDGLDECRLPLNFEDNEELYDVTLTTSVDVLLTNLIQGNLLSSAHIWITTRPAAANQIPSDYVDQVTEIRGFNNPQKEEYFKKKITDQNLARQVIAHVKSSRSLYIMCHIPVFCDITATVLQSMLKKAYGGEIPTTLTQMYIHFLLIQTTVKNKKFHRAVGGNSKQLSDTDRETILKLGKLAFQQLNTGQLIFYEEDLEECGIDAKEALVYCGVCTEIFKEEVGLYEETVFSFVHLSIQEFLAALYVLNTYITKGNNVLLLDGAANQSSEVELFDLHKIAVDNALDSHNGHLDLFLRFLLGLSLDSNQSYLKGLLMPTRGDVSNVGQGVKRKRKTKRWAEHSNKDTVAFIKAKINEELSAERTINLFHCLNELGDNTLAEEVQKALMSGTLSDKDLEPHQCSALAYLLLMSEEVQEEFNPKMYNTSWAGYQRLVPIVKSCRRGILTNCYLTETALESVAYALHSPSSQLRELDLSRNNLRQRPRGGSALSVLCEGLRSSNCRLQILRLSECRLQRDCFSCLANAMQSCPLHLRELDLSVNDPGNMGVQFLTCYLKDPNCKLEKLILSQCGLDEEICTELTLVLRSTDSVLRLLDLRDNPLQDRGVEQLSVGLADPVCKLQALSLAGCLVTEEGCVLLASALSSNPSSQLRELDLSYNHPGDALARLSVVEKLRLNVDHCGAYRIQPGLKKYFTELTFDPDTAPPNLTIAEGQTHATWSEESHPYAPHPQRSDAIPQALCRESLVGRCYWEAEWSGREVDIGVTYAGSSRNEPGGRLGRDSRSWSLNISEQSYCVFHQDKRTSTPSGSGQSQRVGVYLDWGAGLLSFFKMLPGKEVLLHSFQEEFAEPLYAGVWLSQDASVSLGLDLGEHS